jgi:hypothetical protein
MLKLLPSLQQNIGNLVETPDGFEKFMGVQKIYRNKYIELEFLDDNKLVCSLNHPINTTEGIILAKDLTKTIEIIGKVNNTFLKTKKTIRKKIELYDIVNSGKNHWYYANDILNKNCSFIGSSLTLLNANKLAALTHKEPIERNDNIVVYAKPNPTHRYMICADTAEGVEKDYSVAMVFDITTVPYTITAIYKNNNIAPIVFPNIILKLANEYNKAYVLVELNSIGSQVGDILHYDLEYSNLLMTATVGRNGLILGQGFGNKCKFGLQITKTTKRLGYSNMKSVIEDDKLLIEDFGIISELSTYVEKGDSYAADDGSNDDLVACIVLFSWCVTQPYFKELTDLDVAKDIRELHRQEIEDDMAVLGALLINGEELEDGIVEEGGDLWWNAKLTDSYYEYGYEVPVIYYF